MKAEVSPYCSKPKCKGVCFSVPISRLEESLGNRVYECDRCHARYVFTGEPAPLPPKGRVRR